MICELFELSARLYGIKEEPDLLAVCRETLAHIMGPALPMLPYMSNLLTVPLTFVGLYL